MSDYSVSWNYPNHIDVGVGKSDKLESYCTELSLRNPLVVTDPELVKLDLFKDICAALERDNLNFEVFSGIQSNPNESCVDQGVRAFSAGEHDAIIAIGGGSALDAGKAIGLMVGQDRSIWDFEDIGDNWRRVNVAGMVPVIAVPTTAGTGSEVGRASVITDSTEKVKRIIFHPNMLPDYVVLDPSLTLGLPPHITAATGIDALSHCLEALCSPFYHPMAEGVAIEGVRLVKEYLPKAYADGGDLQARTNMLVASTMGATAFQKGLGAMHAIAHSLGAVYGAHHGLLNAVLMPYVLKANADQIEDKMSRLSAYLGFKDQGTEGVIEWVLRLRKELGIPHTLADLDIPDDNFDLLANMSFNDPSASGNPVDFSESEYRRLISFAHAGELRVLHD